MASYLLLKEGGGGGGAPAEGGPSLFDPTLVIPFALMFVVIYFMMIRPQRKERRRTEDFLSGLKKNDKVVTRGGMVGTIQTVRDREVVLKLEGDTRAVFLKQAILGPYVSQEDADKG